MPQKITRLENRNDRWNLVTYKVSPKGKLTEVHAVATSLKVSENPEILGPTAPTAPTAPPPSVPPRQSFPDQFILADDGPTIYGSTLRRTDGPGESKLTYPIDPKHPTDDGKPGQSKATLGPGDTVNGGVKVHHRFFEILFPNQAGSDCPWTAKQFVKSTVTDTENDPAHGKVSVTIDYPAGDPSVTPAVPGGFNSPSWGEDKNPKGVNAADQITGSGGLDGGYLDGPGIAIQNLPASYDAKFRVEVRDCHQVLQEWIEFEVHIAIDAQGKITKDTITPAQHGFGP